MFDEYSVTKNQKKGTSSNGCINDFSSIKTWLLFVFGHRRILKVRVFDFTLSECSVLLSSVRFSFDFVLSSVFVCYTNIKILLELTCSEWHTRFSGEKKLKACIVRQLGFGTM